MNDYVIHWPAAGIIDGEYIHSDNEIMENPLARRTLFIAGVLAGILAPLLVIGLAVVSVEFLTVTADLTIFGSIEAAILVFAVLVTSLDFFLGKVSLSPIRNIAGVVAVSVVLPPVVLYAWFRHRSDEIDDASRIATLAGEGGALRVIAKRMFGKRDQPGRPMTDGGRTR